MIENQILFFVQVYSGWGTTWGGTLGVWTEIVGKATYS